MKERNGVRVGQRVLDLDGKVVGRVKELYDWGFGMQKGFPILFRKDYVFRYDEVRGTRDGALVMARTKRDLIDLAGGRLPDSGASRRRPTSRGRRRRRRRGRSSRRSRLANAAAAAGGAHGRARDQGRFLPSRSSGTARTPRAAPTRSAERSSRAGGAPTRTERHRRRTPEVGP